MCVRLYVCVQKMRSLWFFCKDYWRRYSQILLPNYQNGDVWSGNTFLTNFDIVCNGGCGLYSLITNSCFTLHTNVIELLFLYVFFPAFSVPNLCRFKYYTNTLSRILALFPNLEKMANDVFLIHFTRFWRRLESPIFRICRRFSSCCMILEIMRA